MQHLIKSGDNLTPRLFSLILAISFPQPAILGKETKALGSAVAGSQECGLRLNYAFISTANQIPP
jgi:hypothetical protein